MERSPFNSASTELKGRQHAAEATFRNTGKRLEKELIGKAGYREQIHEMVLRGAAVKLTKVETNSWKRPKWYINHLVAPNPHSTSTLVGIVWNSNQEFQGLSRNGLRDKGPDVLNPTRGALLRFSSGLHAAQGDVKKK